MTAVNMHKNYFKYLFKMPVLFDKLYKAGYNAEQEMPVRSR